MEPIFNIGKLGISADMTTSVSEALKKRELIKVSVLKNCPYDTKEMGEMLSERTRSELVQIVGKKITLYKRNNDDPTIILPK
jgi:RNA-binding protein